MDLTDATVLVTGGASGLGLASVRRFMPRAKAVTILDLPTSPGAELADELGANVHFEAADVTEPDQVEAAVAATAARGPLRALVHCAGRGGSVRVLNKDGSPTDSELFEKVVWLNIMGTFNLLRFGASAMAKNDILDGDRGAIVFTSSVAAYEGQISQLPYATSKAGVIGMTLVAARDLARQAIRVNSIAPGPFDTPILDRFPDEIKRGLYENVPHPKRLGQVDEFAMLAEHIVDNAMLNGETIRIDGALRMPPK